LSVAGELEHKTHAACGECRRETMHDVVHQIETHEASPDGDIVVFKTHRIIRCRGCETLSFQELCESSDDIGDDGEPLTRVTLYPSRTTGRQPIAGSAYFPRKVQRMYLETLQALNIKAPVLATVGMRALVEAICIDRGCTTGNLENKIRALVKQGVLAPKQADFLDLHRFLGNDAAHEMQPPPPSEVLSALDILENLLRTIYELPETAAELTASRDERRTQKVSGLSSTTSTP
jgi:Domain of unknown function (DUF4145)